MAAFPELPGELRQVFPKSFWSWWQAFRSYLLSEFVTQGDVEVSTASSGIVLKSPDGTRWRVTVTNAGVLVVTAL
jgi:hypothetical protein